MHIYAQIFAFIVMIAVILFILHIFLALFHIRSSKRRLFFSICVLVIAVVTYNSPAMNALGLNFHVHLIQLKHTITIIIACIVINSILEAFIWEGILTTKNKLRPPKLLTNMIGTFIYFIGILFIANNIYSLDMTAFLAASGIIAITLAYSTRETLGQLFAGLAIQFDGKLKKGALVLMSTRVIPSGRECILTEFNWRSISISPLLDNGETDTDTIYIVPNSVIQNHVVEVLYQPYLEEQYVSKYFVTSAENRLMEIKNILEQIAIEHTIGGKYNVALKEIDDLENKAVFTVTITISSIKQRSKFVSAFNYCVYSRMRKQGIKEFSSTPPSTEQIMSVLKSNTILNQLPQEKLIELMAASTLEFYAHSEFITHRFIEDTKKAILIIEGATQCGMEIDNQQLKTRTLHQGEIFGIRELLQETKTNITSQAINNINWCLHLDTGTLLEIFKQHPDIREKFHAAIQLRDNEDRMAEEQLHQREDNIEKQFKKPILKKIRDVFFEKK